MDGEAPRGAVDTVIVDGQSHRRLIMRPGQPALSVAPGRLNGMNGDDELSLLSWMYGHDHDDPVPAPRLGQGYVELSGGPLDGSLLDVTSWTEDEIATGAVLMTVLGQTGPDGQARYAARPGDPGRWDWSGDAV
ncbi:hypothetical protein ACFPK5_06590 [Streptomyces beijiangensis]